jgi:hypothetical protein
MKGNDKAEFSPRFPGNGLGIFGKKSATKAYRKRPVTYP